MLRYTATVLLVFTFTLVRAEVQVHLAVPTSGACEGENLYFDYDSPCTWSTAITPDSEATSFRVVREKEPSWMNERRFGHRRFIVSFEHGSDIAIHLHGDEDHDETVANALAKIYSQLPVFVRLKSPHHLILGDDKTGGYFARLSLWVYPHIAYAINLPRDYFWSSEGEPTPEVEEMILHEIGHIFGMHFGWSETQGWSDAVAKDARYITEYAKTNDREDFAESFTAWVVLRAFGANLKEEARSHVERMIPNRLAYLDQELQTMTLTVTGP